MRKSIGWVFAGTLAMSFAGHGPAVASDAESTPRQSRLETVITTRVDGELVTDTEGKVLEVTVTSETDPAIKAMVEKRVRQWRFKPVTINGQPRNVRSGMRISLEATRSGDDYEVRVDNAVFLAPGEDKPVAGSNKGKVRDLPTARVRVLSMAPPVYPVGLLFHGISGKTLLGLRIGLDGHVEAVEVVQSMLLNVRGRDRVLEAAIHEFERVAVAKAKLWRFEVTPKTANPDVSDLTVRVPVVFLMKGQKYEPTDSWQTVVRTPKQALSWLPRPSGVNSPGVADVAAGETFPVASQLELEKNVVGAVL